MTRDSTATRPWFCPQVDDETGWRCPAGTHDTYSAWRHGCASRKSEYENRRYNKLLAAGLNEPRLVGSAGMSRRIEACHFAGWTGAQIAREFGVSVRQVDLYRHVFRNGLRVRVDTCERWFPRLERLAMTTPPEHWQVQRTKRWAHRRGFRPLLAWDDIDDPAEQAPPAPDLADQIAELAGRGLNQLQVARKLDVGEKVVRRRWPEVTVSVDVNVVDAVRARRRHLLDCSDPEAEAVVGAVFRGCLGEGWPKPAVKTAELLDVDYAVVELIRNRVAKRQAHQNKEAS